ncbi:MAG TPA: hypothetical protein VGP89_15010 [Candidatus Angelobacter sp.]|nr:hypothetical protein [Candidatus Angelobacter sp.]
MIYSGMNGAKGRQQPGPGIITALQNFFTVKVSYVLQLLTQGGDGIILVINRLAQVEQAALFCRKQKDQPHHDGKGGIIEALLVHALEQHAVRTLVKLVERLDEDFHRVADLVTKLVSDLLLVTGAFLQQFKKSFFRRHTKEASYAQERKKGTERDWLINP